MAIAKFCIILLVVITQINAEMFPSFSREDDDQRTPHKIILRSKRQQCVCVSVTFPNTVDEFDPSTSSFQCSCDPSSQSATASSSYYQTPLQRQYQQQQELQRELQQAQTSPKSQSTSCGCQLAPQYTSTSSPTTAWSAVSFGTTQSPYDFFQTIQTTPIPNNNYYNNYGNNEIGNNNNNNNIQPLFDCQCVTTPQQNVDTSQNNMLPTYNPTAYDPTSYNQPQQYPQQQQQIQYPPQQQQQQQPYSQQQQQQQQQPQYSPQQQQQVPAYLPPPTTTTTTTPAPLPTTTGAALQNPQNSPRCKCVEIQILLQDPQIQCDCNGQGNGQETRPPFLPPQYTTTTTPRIPFPQYTTTTTQRYYQTTTLPPMTATTRGPPPMYTTAPPRGRPTTQPDALPCVMIQIRTGQKVCACQENYKQCTENVCCNIEKYSSLKGNDDPHHPSPPSAGAATVDLLVDLLQKVRESLV